MARINGNNRDDLLVGTPGDDRIRSFQGDDELFGARGEDSLRGGEGDDELDIAAGRTACSAVTAITSSTVGAGATD